MEKIYSLVEPGKLMHQIFRRSDFKDGRQDLVGPEEFIQCAALQLNAGHTFKPHVHRYKAQLYSYPQESWHVLKGKVKCIFYDLDEKILAEPILDAGDSSFSFFGGHNYLILDDAQILEYKVGPYLGQEKDKVFI